MNNPESAVIRVLFFAKARELSGYSDFKLETPKQITAENLLDLLCDKFSLRLIRNNLILALNEEYCEEGSAVLELKDDDEVAVIPPISGG